MSTNRPKCFSFPVQVMALACLFRPYFLLSSCCCFVLFPFAFPISDSEALLKLKKSFTNAKALDSWVPGSAPCKEGGSWQGLLCSYGGTLIGLRLEGMGLSGTIDTDALVQIKTLRSFSVQNNFFNGNIPEVNRLGALKALYLSGNQFSGEIPMDYFSKTGSMKKVWLSDNSFTGKIPSSLVQLPYLLELHLENNQFNGRIPEFKQTGLQSFNLSNNELTGEIPSSLSKFDAKSFAGNVGLCGEQVGKICTKYSQGIPAPVIVVHVLNKRIVAAIIALGVLLSLVILLAAFRTPIKQQYGYGGRGEGPAEEVNEAQVLGPAARREVSKSIWNPIGDAAAADAELVMVNDELGIFGMPELMKATAQVLGNGTMGSCYRATMNRQVSVVVKRVTEMNALGKRDFDADIRRLGKLRHPNVLTPLAYYYRKHEKLIVYEYLPKGSLFSHLHGDDGASSDKLDWPTRLKIVQGIARGLDYLHTQLASDLELPHGNLKSSNVLLDYHYHPYLSEFGFSSLVSSTRAQTLFAYRIPDAIEDGMVSPKSDIYCLGILIMEILTGKLPSQYLSHDKGGLDVVSMVVSAFSEGRQTELLDPELTGPQNLVGNMLKLLYIGVLCTQNSLEQRLDIKQAVQMIEEIEVEIEMEVELSNAQDGSSSRRTEIVEDNIMQKQQQQLAIESTQQQQPQQQNMDRERLD